MKIWYLYYNEELKKVDYKSAEVTNIATMIIPTNVEDFKDSCDTSEESAIRCSNGYNADISNGSLRFHKCKDCGMYFFTSRSEDEWFKDRNMSIPKRCRHCRAKHRKLNSKEARS